MKKVMFFTTTVLLTILFSCSQKKRSDENLSSPDCISPVNSDNNNLSHYEGKIVQSTTGQWYLIKKGCRWRTNSIQATDNYLKKLPVGPKYIEKNVPVEILHNFPEAGELLPGVIFKKDE